MRARVGSLALSIPIALAISIVASCGFPALPRLGGGGGDGGGGDDGSGSGGGDGGGSSGGPMLAALEPALAATGDTITLEGTFAAAMTVTFPGGATAPATVLGPNRATVVVPATATAGDLTASTGGVTIGPLPFRRTTFALALDAFASHYDQAGGARQDPVLAVARAGAVTVVAGTSLYAIGGVDAGGTVVASVERATINADGTLGAFAPVSSTLVTPRLFATGAVIGHFVYVVGGANAGVGVATVERAAIAADGSLGAFALVPGVSLHDARDAATMSIVGSSLYVVGGESAIPTSSAVPTLTTIERATIHADGTLDPFVVDTAALATARAGHTTVTIGNFVYVIGGVGATGTTLASVERAAIHGDGSLDSFADAGAGMAVGRFNHGSVVLGGFVYNFGGFDTTTFDATIERAAIHGDGSIDSFTQIGVPLAAATSSFTVAIAGNYVYLVGGSTSSGVAGAIERAGFDADGMVTGFVNAPTAMTTPRANHCSVVIGQTLYVIGGEINSNQNLNTIEHATVAADGTVGSFTMDSITLITPRDGHMCAVIGNFVYVLGGEHAGASLSTIERSTIAADGTLGPFITIGNLSTPRFGATAVALGNTLFVIGGLDATQATATVERATFDASGALGPFSINPALALNQPRDIHSSVVTSTSVLVIGGSNNGNLTGTVERASINPDNTMTTFSTFVGITLPQPRAGHTSAVIGNQLYLFGGIVNGGVQNGLDQATLQPDGTMSSFTTSSATGALMANAFGASNAVLGNTVFVLGGSVNGGSSTPVVLSAGLQ